MSLFGSLMGDMERDPIFGAHHRMMNQMNQMNRMMNSMMGGMGMGFGGMGMGMMEPPLAIDDGHGHGHRSRGAGDMMPFGGGSFLSPFGPMGGFPDVGQMIRHDPNAHSFSSMSVTSITSGPDGRPQVYQASNQTATAPGGVRETRKAVADTRTGTKKLSVGRHMGQKGHVREREENMFTGQREENEELINLEENEAPVFDREWRQRAYGGGYSHSTSMPAITGGSREHGRQGRRAQAQPQIGYPTRTPESTPTVTIEELPASDDEEQPRETEAPKSSFFSRHSPYTRDKDKGKKDKSKRTKKY